MLKCPLQENKVLKKKPRGSFHFRSDGNVEAVKWNDNSVVTLLSNVDSVDPLGKTSRRVKGKGEAKVDYPYIVKSYNVGMGGVDLLDRALSDLRPSVHGRKWYWPLLVNALNIGLVYCWKLRNFLNEKQVTQKEFRRTIAFILVNGGKSVERQSIQDLAPAILFLWKLEYLVQDILGLVIRDEDVLYVLSSAE